MTTSAAHELRQVTQLQRAARRGAGFSSTVAVARGHLDRLGLEVRGCLEPRDAARVVAGPVLGAIPGVGEDEGGGLVERLAGSRGRHEARVVGQHLGGAFEVALAPATGDQQHEKEHGSWPA